MKRTALGLTTPDGREPALSASTPSPPCRRAKACAIWLRLAFSTHTNSTRLSGADMESPKAMRGRAAIAARGMEMEGWKTQQQPDAGAQHDAIAAGRGATACGCGLHAAPSVAQAAPAA